ncbi:ImmA/IrrE family metallo-endopeptidase [Thermoanaerobacter brockii subsp. lactiethylicus]
MRYKADEIERIVNRLVNKHGCSNPYYIAKENNIVVIKISLDKVYGFYKYIKRNKFIFINSDVDEQVQLLTCSHELGHAVLHPRENTIWLQSFTLFSTDRLEIEANLFALSLLRYYNKFDFFVLANLLKIPETFLNSVR